MYLKISVFAVALLLANCRGQQAKPVKAENKNPELSAVPNENEVGAIAVPDGYDRVSADSGTFGSYLRRVGIKKDKRVFLFNGSLKQNQKAQYAVLNISVGNKDLQQCADAVMRLRAEYLYGLKRFQEILFTDNEKKQYAFQQPYNRIHFDQYLQKVFGMCGSASLEMQLKSKRDLNKIQVGDVFIKGGFPGHAVIVMDLAANEKGEKVFLLAQSYMPAQDIHILKNPNDSRLTPWYAINEIDRFLYTPEYTFTDYQLREW
jgi:hypothetical protein